MLPDMDFVVRCCRKVRIGPMRVEIRSNEAHFTGMRYFPGGHDWQEPAEADYILNFCNLSLDGPWKLDQLSQARDRNYRGGRFAAGYYLTDHFGPPAYLLTRYPQYWVFGTDFARILWPFFVKLLLTLYAMKCGMLHLKAASLAVGGAGTLLVGRGGSGKTVLLAGLCQMGARFLSNTHTLVDGEAIVAVPAAMRVRRDALFAALIADRQLEVGIKPGEFVADPLTDLQWQTAATAPLRTVCLVDYRGPGSTVIREIDREVLLDYMEQFSLALNVYGLKEDVLDHLEGNVAEFSDYMSGTRMQLLALVERCRPYYVSCDATDPRNLVALYELIRPPGDRSPP